MKPNTRKSRRKRNKQINKRFVYCPNGLRHDIRNVLDTSRVSVNSAGIIYHLLFDYICLNRVGNL